MLAGAEGYTESSTYFDMFDNLLAKRITDSNLRDELKNDLKKELQMFKDTFSFKRLAEIEDRVEENHRK